MAQATLTDPDLDAFCRLNEPGLTAISQRIEPDLAVLECRLRTLNELDPWHRKRDQQSVARGTFTRQLALVPLRWRPTMLKLRIRRYRRPGCHTVGA